MIYRTVVWIFTIFIIVITPFVNLDAQALTNERAEWFTDARFGMFIHWGVYSGAEGYWKGEKLRDNNDYAEWIQYRNRIDQEEYLTLLDRFDWVSIDPEEWVILAKKSGMKYVTITAKHHDGFALWDSEVSDYDVADHTNPRRDIIGELAAACKKHGLKMGLYYSHWVDWEHPQGWDHTKELTDFSNEEFDIYWQEKVIPQMRELLTQYGELGLIWFDMWVHHSQTVVSKSQLMQLKALIRELQPNCLVNSRLGLSVEEDRDVDFQTLGDNQFGDTMKDHPWQSPGTVAHSWGFHAGDTEWKSTTYLLHSLINNVSLNGNFMLNIGPRANGDVPYEIEQRLLSMGDWLDVNGGSIYGSGGIRLGRDLHDWGKMTYKTTADGRHLVYLHVYNWPLTGNIPLTGISTQPSAVYLMADKQKQSLSYEFNRVFTQIQIPELQPDPLVSVIVVEYDRQPELEQELVAKLTTGGYSLTPWNAISLEGNPELISNDRRGSIPRHMSIDGRTVYQWRVYVEQPKSLSIDVSYKYPNDSGKNSIALKIGDKTVKHQLQPTGMMVTEPNREWHVGNFKSHTIGEMDISEAGYYDIQLEINTRENSPVGFQWVWLE